MAELQKEISDERNRDELKRIIAGGVVDSNQKLEWMYRGPKDLLNREDYLLGRTVDKTFEELDKADQQPEDHLGVIQPINHVEHECVPFSIRHYKDTDSSVQVDMARKMAEDPLVAIKQKEMESRKKLLENPVKLKELKMLLQKEQESKAQKKRKGDKRSKKDKKAKPKKSKKYDTSTSSDSESDINGDDELFEVLAAKYAKIQSVVNQEIDDEDLDFQDVVDLKYEKLSNELDKMSKSKKKKHKTSSSESSADEKDARRSKATNSRSRTRKEHSPNRKIKNRRRSPPNQHTRRNRSRTPSPKGRPQDKRADRHHDYREREEKRYTSSSRNSKLNDERRRTGRNPSPRPELARPQGNASPKHRADNRSSDKDARKLSTIKANKGATRRCRSNSTSSSSSSSQHDNGDDDDDRLRPVKQKFGLVTSAGKSIKLKNSAEHYKKSSTSKSSHSSAAQAKETWRRPTAPKLTDEERAAKLKEMMTNAEVRNVERESSVRKHYAKRREEEEKMLSQEFDKNFVHKEFNKSITGDTVESRIKSIRNNIQRNSGAMDTNFAKR